MLKVRKMLPQNAKSLDVSAKTIDEAIEHGLAQLGLSREQVDIEIIKEGKRGVFGLGSEDAQVRLTVREPVLVPHIPQADTAPPEAAAESAEPPSPPESEAPAEISGSPQVSSQQEPISDTGESVGEIAKKCLSDLLRLMGIQAEVTVRTATDLAEPGETPPTVLDITGNDLGILIGRRSETLRALQYMVRLIVSKKMRSWQPIIVDVESYRVRRHRSLHQMAERMAERAVATGRRVVLEAMPAYERRIIHIALKDHPKVFTKSIGGEDNRKVTIIPK